MKSKTMRIKERIIESKGCNLTMLIEVRSSHTHIMQGLLITWGISITRFSQIRIIGNASNKTLNSLFWSKNETGKHKLLLFDSLKRAIKERPLQLFLLSIITCMFWGLMRMKLETRQLKAIISRFRKTKTLVLENMTRNCLSRK